MTVTVAMLMHVSLTASTLILQPFDVAGMRALTYDLVLAAALWMVVAAVALASSGKLPATTAENGVKGGPPRGNLGRRIHGGRCDL